MKRMDETMNCIHSTKVFDEYLDNLHPGAIASVTGLRNKPYGNISFTMSSRVDDTERTT